MSRRSAAARHELSEIVESPIFRHFIFRIVEASGIGIPASKDERALIMEGKRLLGLEILGWVEAALPDTTSSSQPLAALHWAIGEDITPKETKNDDRSESYSRE